MERVGWGARLGIDWNTRFPAAAAHGRAQRYEKKMPRSPTIEASAAPLSNVGIASWRKRSSSGRRRLATLSRAVQFLSRSGTGFDISRGAGTLGFIVRGEGGACPPVRLLTNAEQPQIASFTRFADIPQPVLSRPTVAHASARHWRVAVRAWRTAGQAPMWWVSRVALGEVTNCIGDWYALANTKGVRRAACSVADAGSRIGFAGHDARALRALDQGLLWAAGQS